MPDTPLKVFISYSHKDESFKDDLKDHLSALVRGGQIELWQDRDMEGGTRWDDQIKQALKEADIVLLLISSKFMASKYINDVELQGALARDAQGTARVIPIILKPTDLQGTEIKQLQALPKDGKAVSKWSDPDEAYVDIVRGIRRVVDSLWDKPRAAARVTSVQSSPSQPETDMNTSAMLSPMKKRLAISNRLSGMLKGDFDQLLFVLAVPSEIAPAASLPQKERAAQLLTWAVHEDGCGLDQLAEAIQMVTGKAVWESGLLTNPGANPTRVSGNTMIGKRQSIQVRQLGAEVDSNVMEGEDQDIQVE